MTVDSYGTNTDKRCMSVIGQILLLANEYGRSLGVGPHTVSWRVFGDSKKLSAMINGADIQVKRAEAAIRWFSDNWPEGAEWPTDVPRPQPAGAGAAA